MRKRRIENRSTIIAYQPRSELQELVEAPNETLEVEYKEWLDFSEATVCASLARHIAAMANHGGGRIVIGIKDIAQVLSRRVGIQRQ